MEVNWTIENRMEEHNKGKWDEYRTMVETELLTQKDLYHDCLMVLQEIYWNVDCELPTDEDVRESMHRIFELVWAIGQKVMTHEDELRRKRGQPEKLREYFIQFY